MRISSLKKMVPQFLIAFIVGLSFGVQLGVAQIPGTQGVTAVFAIGTGEIAAYDASSKLLRFFAITAGSAHERAVVAVPGQVMGVIALSDVYVIATGMGRGDLTPPIRVHTLDKHGLGRSRSALKVVYERVSERPQVTQLRECGGKVLIGLFESKYNTVIGELVPSSAAAGGQWRFSEKVQLRMGDSFDCIGDALVVGRSYGDSQGQDGDLLLIQPSGERTLLPSYRGVRGVESIGSDSEPMVIIGDGWHPNYGEMAQGRISLVKKRSGESRFALELIDRDLKNFNFTKFRSVRVAAKQFLVALGSSQIILYEDLFGSANKREVYTQVGKSHLLDFAVGVIADGELAIVVADEGLHIIRVKG